MKKIFLFNRYLIKKYGAQISILISTISFILIFFKIPKRYEWCAVGLIIAIFIAWYFILYRWARSLTTINLKIEGSTVVIKVGDLFEQNGLKSIGFNEYFDTIVDNKIIAETSLNGCFIKKYIKDVKKLNDSITNDEQLSKSIIYENNSRKAGKKIKYKIGSVHKYTTADGEKFLLTALSKFDEDNKAYLSMPEYLEFLIEFWNQINHIYAGRPVSVPIFGSGLTRIQGHKDISDEELLKIMLWTFKVSEMRFKYPAKLSIIIHKDKINEINLFEIKETSNGL